MYARWIQTLDPSRFALDKVQYVVQQLQANNQDFIVMVDPAVFSGTPNSSVSEYGTYQRGVQEDVFMKLPKNGELYQGVVWPGPTVFPDWTAENAQDWWTDEFRRFFDPSTGFDVSGIWLGMFALYQYPDRADRADMNEPANFLPYVSLGFLFSRRSVDEIHSDESSSRQTSTASARNVPSLLPDPFRERSLDPSRALSGSKPAPTSLHHGTALRKPSVLCLLRQSLKAVKIVQTTLQMPTTSTLS